MKVRQAGIDEGFGRVPDNLRPVLLPGAFAGLRTSEVVALRAVDST